MPPNLQVEAKSLGVTLDDVEGEFLVATLSDILSHAEANTRRDTRLCVGQDTLTVTVAGAEADGFGTH